MTGNNGQVSCSNVFSFSVGIAQEKRDS